MTANEPTYGSDLTGDPKGVSPFTVLGPGCPDTDPLNPGGRRLRGYVLAWAVDPITGVEISLNHLKGDALIVHYQQGSAWEYNAWAFQVLENGTNRDGTLDLNGLEYDAVPSSLLLDFYASGSVLSSGLLNRVGVDTDLTLWVAIKDLRQPR